MLSLCSIDGTIVDASKGALLPLSDRLWLYGDGAFDTICWHDHRLHLGERHLARLIESVRRLGLYPPSATLVEGWCRALVERSEQRRCAVRVTAVPQGAGGLIPLAPAPIHIAITLRTVPSVEQATVPVAAALSELRFQPPRTGLRIKSNDYRHVAMEARRLAMRSQAHAVSELLFANAAGNLIEGGTSNLVAVVEGEIVTPPLSCGVLPGVTRGWLVEAARERGIVVREEMLPPIETLVSRGARLYRTNAAVGIQPIGRCGDHVLLSDPAADPLAELRAAFWAA